MNHSRFGFPLLGALLLSSVSWAVELPTPGVGAANIVGRADAYTLTLETDGEVLSATGNVALTYATAASSMALTAAKMVMNFQSGQLAAHGEVVVRRREGEVEQILTGDNFNYNFSEKTGQLDQARVEVPPLIFKGQSLRMTGDGLIVRSASFTGCDREEPHYRLTTDSIEIIPGQAATTRRAALWIGHRRLFSLPQFRVSLKKGEKKERRKLLPKTVINGHDLLMLQSKRELHWFPEAGTDKASLDLGLSAKQGFRGGLYLQRQRPTYRAELSLTRKSFGADPLRSKVMLTRRPELRLELLPRPAFDDRTQFSGEFSVGTLQEFPTEVHSQRLHGQVAFSRTFDPPGALTDGFASVLLRHSRYDRGLTYTDLGLEVAVRGRLRSNMEGELGLVLHDLSGRTPFEFDDVDIRREVRLSGDWLVDERWRVPFRLRYDMDTQTWGNREVGLVRRAHCLEYGLTWDQARSELGLEVGFLGL